MSDMAEARGLAMGLPETSEQDHHGMSSFRIRGKIFATVADEQHIRVMVDEDEIHAAVAESPTVCTPFYWGKRLACVVVTLPSAAPDQLRELLTEAWLRKPPTDLARDFRNQL